MKVFSATTTCRVCPEKWHEINDDDIMRMFEGFRQWFFMNEESMTFSEWDEAAEMHDKWLEHLASRGLIQLEEEEALS